MICAGMKKFFSLPPFGGASVKKYAKIMVGGNPYHSFFFSYFFIPAMGAPPFDGVAGRWETGAQMMPKKIPPLHSGIFKIF